MDGLYAIDVGPHKFPNGVPKGSCAPRAMLVFVVVNVVKCSHLNELNGTEKVLRLSVQKGPDAVSWFAPQQRRFVQNGQVHNFFCFTESRRGSVVRATGSSPLQSNKITFLGQANAT